MFQTADPLRVRLSPTLWPRDVTAAIASYLGGEPGVWLDRTHGRDEPRVSLVARRPRQWITQYGDGAARLCAHHGLLDQDQDAWQLLRRVYHPRPKWSAPTRFGPGWVGSFGYELAGKLERIQPRIGERSDPPVLWLGLFDRVILLDHREFTTVGVELVCDDMCPARPSEDPDWLMDWNRACTARTAPGPRPQKTSARFRQSREQYDRMIRRALQFIAAGDVYQVNLAQRIDFSTAQDAFELSCAMRTSNPAPYSAFIRTGSGDICSVSPELFLDVRDGRVRTRPIKGTRRRSGDTRQDQAALQDLLSSSKDAAELAMIVDLHRNDLGRVCETGSIRVETPRAVETHPTVMHTVAEVTGRLAQNVDALDLLRACFPAGSVTGAPKLRAMQIIRELESDPRGAYTGAIGWLGLTGDMELSVAIRIAQVRDGRVTVHVGGGIVAESGPEAEFAETLAKAEGILRGAGATLPMTW